jgi:hypothetical protein
MTQHALLQRLNESRLSCNQHFFFLLEVLASVLGYRFINASRQQLKYEVYHLFSVGNDQQFAH